MNAMVNIARAGAMWSIGVQLSRAIDIPPAATPVAR